MSLFTIIPNRGSAPLSLEEGARSMSVSPSKATRLERNSRLDYGTEDELSAPLKLSRTTPRSSLAGGPNAAASKVTPYADVS